MNSLKDKIFAKSNDYTKEEESFEKVSGLKFVDSRVQPCNLKTVDIKMTIIISCYMGHKTLPIILRALNIQTYKDFEVVIVDDGSPNSMEKVVLETSTKYPVKFVREVQNMGRSYTRNTGLMMSEGDCVVFIDQDIIVNRDFVYNFAVRQKYTSNCIFLGFKNEIGFEDIKRDCGAANYKNDWRYWVKGEKYFLNLTLKQEKSKNPEREYYLLKETENFKKFGFGLPIGFWDLSAMVISHSLCVEREVAVDCGGFPEQGFDGWGAQDIAFGARLIGMGSYVVPVLNNTVWHISHERYSGSRKAELEELKKNVVSYFRLANSKDWRAKMTHRVIEKKLEVSNKKFYTLPE